MAILFRPHRGGLAEAMEEVKEVSSFDELVNMVDTELSKFDHGLQIDENTVKMSAYGYDHRIDWDTYSVVLKNYGVLGFTSGPLT